MVFDAALYALSSLKQGDIVLKKEQSVKTCFCGCLLGLASQYVSKLFPLQASRIESPLPQRSVVVVVSPLVSLMVDQVTSLCLRGVSAAILIGFQGGDRQHII